MPDLDDQAAVTAWLDALNEQTTDCCLSIYGSSSDQRVAEIGDTYTDVRKQVTVAGTTAESSEAVSENHGDRNTSP